MNSTTKTTQDTTISSYLGTISEANSTYEEDTTPEENTTLGSSNTTIDGTTPPPSELTPGAIAGITVGCSVVALLILLTIIYRKKLAKLCSKKHEPSPYMPTAPSRLNKNKFYDESLAAEEFAKLQDFKSNKPKIVGLDPKNSSKNRYSDIVPYDFNQVRLASSDYINASHIEPFFIATQDPMLDGTDPLWQMVWESNVAVIVRLSPEEEGAASDSNDGQQRCAVYIPPRKWVVGTPEGDIEVVTGDVERNEAFVMTELTLTKYESTRQVTHYHIQDWRDDKYPNATVTWNTISKIRWTKPSKDRKVLVHCGAGAGRTGTFIALWMLNESHRDKKDTSILNICLRLREQRPGMVSRLYQYDYIYKCAAVLAEGPLKVRV